MSLPRLLLVLSLLLASAAHASEVALSEPRFGPAAGAQAREIGSVASGGGTDLVTWTEEFNAFFPSTWLVYVRTYDAGGAPLQQAQRAIAAGYGALAVWNGSDYFVAYSRFFSKFGTILPAPDVEAVRVTAEGRVVDGSRVSLIETRASGGNILALAWDGTHYLASVVADVQRKLLLLDREGHIVRAQDAVAPSIAALPGGGFVILRGTPAQLQLVRVAPDGELGASVDLGIDLRGDAKIAVHGDRIAVMWQSDTGGVAKELDNDGHVLLSVALPEDAALRSLVWRDSSWVAAYARNTEGCIVRFASGVATSTTCSSSAREPFVGSDRAAWIEKGVEVRTSRDLSLAGGEIASVSATMQSDAAAVATSTGSLAAWSENGALHIGGFTRDGFRRADRVIDTEAEPHHPVFATAGAQTLLVYADGSTIRAVRLDADGRSLAPAFTIGRGDLPSVATDGDEWLVVWQSLNVQLKPQVVAARVTVNGDTTAEVPVFANGASQDHASVAWSGAGYIVAWNEVETALSGRHTRTMTQLVDRNGARIANALTLADEISGLNLTAASIACGPASCLATWIADGVFGAVLGPDGTRRSENRLLTRLSPLTVILAPAADGTFRVAYDALYVFVDASGAPHGNVVWLPSHSTIAGIADGRVFYTRVTDPEESLGNAMRLFAREEPPPPRVRPVAH